MGQNWGYNVGIYMAREKTDLHKCFADEIQNIMIKFIF